MCISLEIRGCGRNHDGRHRVGIAAFAESQDRARTKELNSDQDCQEVATPMKSKTIRRTQAPREDLLATGRADSPVTQGSRITRLFLKVGVIVVALWSAAVVTPVTPREQEPSAAGL